MSARGRSSLGIDREADCFARPFDATELRKAPALIEPVVRRIRAEYVKRGFDELRNTVVEVSDRERDNARHFGACRQDGRLIVVSPKLVFLAPDTMAGIIAHEFGHAADYAYPAHFSVSTKKVSFKRTGQRSNDGISNAVYERWLHRSDDEVELWADAIAQAVLGLPIGYEGPCMLQTLYRGERPRPQGLR